MRTNNPTRKGATRCCVSLSFLGLMLAGCSTGSSNSAGGGGGAGGVGGAAGDGRLPSVHELEHGWNELLPGGGTLCSRGGEFSFFVHPGTVDKVVIDFMGGGACWDRDTCAVETGHFVDSVEPFREAFAGGILSGFDLQLDGIYNRARDDNPFKDWHHVVIPYCSGDIHWGDASQDYEGIPIEHRGAVNTRAVLDWIYENYEAPEQIFVTGCSAGSLGALLWSAYVMEHYPDTQVIQFGDSEAGIITDEFYQKGFPNWNAEVAFPSWIPGLEPAAPSLRVPSFYARIAGFYPTNFMSQFNSLFDSAQPFCFQLMGGGDVQTWSREMLSSLDAIEARAKNYASFVAAGSEHCILPRESFYTTSANGTTLIEWLGELLSDGSVDSVKCGTSSAFGLRPGINDIESTDECGLATGVASLCNSQSRLSVGLNQDDPLDGEQDVLIEFELRNESDDPELGSWSQWNLVHLATAEGHGNLLDDGVSGIRFLARADHPRTMRVDFESSECHRLVQGICFGWQLQLTDEATIYDLALAEATLPSWTDDDGEDLLATLSRVAALNLRPEPVGIDEQGLLEAHASDPGWVQIDDIELFQ